MNLTLYEASVPVFTRYLGQLARIVALAEDHASTRSIDPHSVLQARLAPSMYPFAVQVEIAANFAFRACAPLAGMEIPPCGEHRASFAALKTRIAQTLAFLATLTPDQMEAGAGRQFVSQAGLGAIALAGPAFLQQYALPNFFFHVTTAYAILRHLGVELGKADYDGFHVYAGQSSE